MVTEYARPSLMKLYRQAGFDFVFFEYEHAFFGPTELADAVLSARDSGLPVVAKTPQLGCQEVAKLLECGVVGIQLPRTETREEIETLRSYLKFPPAGTRAAMQGVGNSDYVRSTDVRGWMAGQDEETTLVVHIETKRGYENAEEIISTPGVDMVYVGQMDLSIEMGRPGDYEHPDLVGPIDEMLAMCQQYQVPFGTTASGLEAAARSISKGARFFLVGDELGFILQATSQVVRDYRSLVG